MSENGALKAESSASTNVQDPRKIFVGGLHWETTEDELKEYFGKFGTVTDATIKLDPAGQSRGFGFVLFAEEASVDNVLGAGPLALREKKIEAKKASVKEIKKIFVGGVNPALSEAELRAHFEQFGEIEAMELPLDKEKGTRRGFIFVTFATTDGCDAAAGKGMAKQKIGDCEVDVKKAVPNKNKMMGGGGFGGGYDAYGYGYPGYGYGYPGYGMPPPRGRGGMRGRGRGAASYGAYPAYDPYAGYDFSQDYGYGDGYGYAAGGGKMRGRGRGARGAPY